MTNKFITTLLAFFISLFAFGQKVMEKPTLVSGEKAFYKIQCVSDTEAQGNLVWEDDGEALSCPFGNKMRLEGGVFETKEINTYTLVSNYLLEKYKTKSHEVTFVEYREFEHLLQLKVGVYLPEKSLEKTVYIEQELE